MAGFVAGEEYNLSINLSWLPYNTSVWFNVSNYTTNTTLVLAGNFTTIGLYPANSSLQANITIPAISLGNYTANISLFNETFDNITNTTSIEEFYNLTLRFDIFNDTPIADVEYVQLSFNEFEYSLCDYQLPWNTTKQITINAPENMIVYTDYDSRFFTLPNSFNMTNTNQTTLDVKIWLDDDTGIGRFTRVIDFSVVSEFSNVTFHFDIRDCKLPLTSCDEYFDEMSDYCNRINKTSSDILECQRLTAEYYDCIYTSLQEAATNITFNNGTVKYVNQTQYVPVLEINDSTLKTAIENLPLMWKQIQSDKKSSEAQIREMQGEIDNLNAELTTKDQSLADKVKEILADLYREDKENEQTIKDLEEKTYRKGHVWTTTIILIITLLTVLTVRYVSKNIIY